MLEKKEAVMLPFSLSFYLNRTFYLLTGLLPKILRCLFFIIKFFRTGSSFWCTGLHPTLAALFPFGWVALVRLPLHDEKTKSKIITTELTQNLAEDDFMRAGYLVIFFG